VSLTYERLSATALNGRSPSAPASGISGPAGSHGGSSGGSNGRGAGYSVEEVAARTGVPRAVLAVLAREQYTAIDVVRLAVMDRLMRSGVPVARAAALVQAAETLARAAI
jgi:hypothetical protein